jgi:hypothetical protein
MASPAGGDAAVDTHLDAVPDARRRDDARAVTELMREVTGVDPVLWPGGIVGFGTLHYRYESGRVGDTVVVGLAPRKQALTLYGLFPSGSSTPDDNPLLARLGPHTTGKGCLYLKDLSRTDLAVLRSLITDAWAAGHRDLDQG